jgi:uncharacterized membrane protein YphA (DoxX/SURF4 family)
MTALVDRVRRTGASKLLLLPRLLAGGPLVAFGVMHFLDLQHFRDILTAAGAPLVEPTAVAASAAEVAAGVLMLTGFFARVGGLLGVATMLPAILTTVKFLNLPEHPFVPPLPLPVAVLLGSAAVLWWGAGALSADRAAAPSPPAT